MKFGVVVFPGSNCDADCHHAVKNVLGAECDYLWHQDTSVAGYDAIILPGGFSYGDYLRTGAIARFSPIMAAVADFARAGGLVLGICNGFQILLEAGLLPGAMRRNAGLSFRCEFVNVRVENAATPFTSAYQAGQVLRLPIAHGEGNYYADPATLAALEAGRQVVLRYSEPDGRITPAANPNGSLGNVAALVNKEGNVLGMMPHPERSSEAILGSEDGRGILTSMLQYLQRRRAR
ncbi:phosphoribosylformylglycinamidine synthase subunit PurQ [Gelria sp. Kuro-4]|uniref:phosphoribosylformylglycinamidine synthase subunit PurQ n=1 Tax=Gelria sp. Kuro-4 TaxID=2796927 RepID=UPI001BEF65B0|nr:phosphoribosylformylglycinamidine synthase subunit PurQ [Gelria sp. Kuro-4]BCV24465.1 phosphoribosylformylglycinamidine synthase subunit PurQ [Gelria sp. Kuro-4]